MTWFTSKLLLLTLLLLVVSGMQMQLQAQEDGKSPYEVRMDRYHHNWNRLIPRYFKAHYAGSMGLVSAGVGWNHGRKEQWETDFIVGYVPKYNTERFRICFTLKENYIPWTVPVKNSDFRFAPLTCSFYMNTILGDEFWVAEPSKYPTSYYAFSSKIRFNLSLGQRLTYSIPESRRLRTRSVSFFYEVSSNDLYIVSAFGNPNYLRPADYLHLGFGVKMQWL